MFGILKWECIVHGKELENVKQDRKHCKRIERYGLRACEASHLRIVRMDAAVSVFLFLKSEWSMVRKSLWFWLSSRKKRWKN